MIEAARKAECIPKCAFRPKKYWCPDLSRARDTKRFWWQLWVANDRLRQGMVYRCYKNVKRLFRKLSKSCVQSSQNKLCHSLDNLLHRNMNSFWKRIKRQENSHIHSSMPCSKLADCFASIMQDNSPLTDQQQFRSKHSIMIWRMTQYSTRSYLQMSMSAYRNLKEIVPLELLPSIWSIVDQLYYVNICLSYTQRC